MEEVMLFLSRCLRVMIKVYRLISPSWKPCCRFYPSCSAYAEQALEHHSLIKALWLITRRILKCHPGHPGGHDPICIAPQKKQSETSIRRINHV